MMKLQGRSHEAALIHTMLEALMGTAHEDGGATSQLDLPSLGPLTVASCSRLELGVPYWDSSADYCK